MPDRSEIREDAERALSGWRVREALKETFRDTISLSAGEPFEATGVAMPADAVWDRYANAAVAAIYGVTDASEA